MDPGGLNNNNINGSSTGGLAINDEEDCDVVNQSSNHLD
jgi:hypothetical protein